MPNARLSLLLVALGGCSMVKCRLYSAWDLYGSFPIPAMEASRLTFTSNGTIVRPSSGSTPSGWSRGFGRKEINRVRELVEEHREQLLESWNEFFHG